MRKLSQGPQRAGDFILSLPGLAWNGRLHGEHINLFIEKGPPLGPVLEIMVDSVEAAKLRLVKTGCQIR
jgi:hypothetical protein